MSRVGPREKDVFDGYTVWYSTSVYKTACHGSFWNLMVSFYDFFYLLVWRNNPTQWWKQSGESRVVKAAVQCRIWLLLWSQPVVGRQNPTNLISFLIKQPLQFMGWSAKEFFCGILIYLPPKWGRTPKSVTSSSKHSFWPTNGVEGDLRRSNRQTLTLLFQGLQKREWSWVGAVDF